MFPEEGMPRSGVTAPFRRGTVTRALLNSPCHVIVCFAGERGEDGPAVHPYRFKCRSATVDRGIIE